jgi:hypothetical protein
MSGHRDLALLTRPDYRRSLRVLEIVDDSAFLALVDPGAYRGFVHADWTLELLLAHFAAEMAERRLLIWGTGNENTWVARRDRRCALPPARIPSGGGTPPSDAGPAPGHQLRDSEHGGAVPGRPASPSPRD